MTSVEHATFAIERELPASPKHAFRFFAEAELKGRWNECHPDWSVLEEYFDFREGGEERKRWLTGDGSEQTFRAHYLDIVPSRRIIYAYEMGFKGSRVSASLVTVDFAPRGAATRMIFIEQAAYLGAGMHKEREAGTEWSLDRLVDVIAAEQAGVH
jgi:uncharacterized protein YndB with AHSA1/START domain